jgi:hypothetical protein
LISLFSIRQPVFIWGPPGIGKSRVVKSSAREQGLEVIDIRAILLDPVDRRGLPRISADGTFSGIPGTHGGGSGGGYFREHKAGGTGPVRR